MKQQLHTLRQMVNAMPVNVMLIDLKDSRVNFVNQTGIDNLRQLEHILPIKADAIVGQCVDNFHKIPWHRRRIISDPGNLPHYTRIELGGECLDIMVSPIHDGDGNYIGPMLTWTVVTRRKRLADDFQANVRAVVESLAASSTKMKTTAQAMTSTAQQTREQAETVAAASGQAFANVQTVAAAAEE